MNPGRAEEQEDRAQTVRPSYSGHGQVTVVTDLTGGGDLGELHRELSEQTFVDWMWLVVSREHVEMTCPDDHRFRALPAPSRAQALQEILSFAGPYVVVLHPGQELGPTAFEKWIWFLDATQECEAVSAAAEDGGDAPLMFRRSLLERCQGFDAAVALARRRLGTAPIPRRDGTGVGERFPHPDHDANAWLPEGSPCSNSISKTEPRLLILSTWMSVGGSDKVQIDLLDQLRSRGWRGTVATTVPSKHDWLPVYARRTSDLFPLEHFLRPLDYPRFLVYLIESRQPDAVLISNSELAYRLLPYLRAHCPDTPFVDFCHSEAEHWNHGGYPRFSVEYQESLDLTITTSQHLRRWMVDRGGDPDRIEVCYANVDTGRIQPDPSQRRRIRSRLGVPEDEPLVLFGGRVSEDKQPHVVAGALARLARAGTRFTGVVVGDGPDLEWLRYAARRQGIDSRIRIVGARPHHELIEFMQAADVFFLPSRSEGIAMTIFEAMACGVPVVGAAVGGQAELVDADCGVLVQRGTAHDEIRSYAAAIGALLHDDSRRTAMGERAREKVLSDFDLALMGGRISELLETAAALRTSSPRGPTPTRRAARASATETVELMRLTRVIERRGWSDDDRKAVGTLAYLALRRLGGPVYRHGLSRGWRFLPTTTRLARRMLLRSA